jgi:hypothetical protein
MQVRKPAIIHSPPHRDKSRWPNGTDHDADRLDVAARKQMNPVTAIAASGTTMATTGICVGSVPVTIDPAKMLASAIIVHTATRLSSKAGMPSALLAARTSRADMTT